MSQSRYPHDATGRGGMTISADVWPQLIFQRTSEKRFMQQVVDYARLRGWTVWHDNATNRRRRCPQCGAASAGARNAAGLLDLILLRERLVWAELKTTKGTLTAAQRAWLDGLQAAGQECYVWTPASWDTLTAVLA